MVIFLEKPREVMANPISQPQNDFQTRSSSNGLQYFPSFKDALNEAKRDQRVWKISYSLTKEDGEEDGKEDGKEDGEEDGEEDGKDDGEEDGKEDGEEDGYHRWVKQTKAEYFETTEVKTTTNVDGEWKTSIRYEHSSEEEIDTICSLNKTFRDLPDDDYKTIFWVDQPLGSYAYKQQHGFHKILAVLTDKEFEKMVSH